MTVLVLGGTGEGRALAAALSARGVDVLSSLAGLVRAPLLPPGRVRIGGFGGAAGFRACLADHAVRAIIDATHPFAAAITARSQSIAAEMGVPYLRLERPGWTPRAGDRWSDIADEAATAALIPPGARVFLATGRQSLARFDCLPGRALFARVIDPPEQPFPFAGGAFIVGRPPFTVQSETGLFRELRIDWLVAKNAGGALARPKLDAARDLGLPVAMLARPARGPGNVVETVAEAEAWILAQT